MQGNLTPALEWIQPERTPPLTGFHRPDEVRKRPRLSREQMSATTCGACLRIAGILRRRPKGMARSGLTPAREILRSRGKSHNGQPRADPKFHECLARGGTCYEAFKQHKSRLRTRAFQDFYGLEPTPPEAREARPPPMMSPTSSPAGRGLLPAKGKSSPKPNPKRGTHRQLPAAVAPGAEHLGCNWPKAEDF